MYQELKSELNLFEKILFFIFYKYSIKIYKIGVKKGYNWNS